MKLGPLNKVMGMIPGIPPWMAQSAGGQEGGDRIKGTSQPATHYSRSLNNNT
jgi:hypothetical protein